MGTGPLGKRGPWYPAPYMPDGGRRGCGSPREPGTHSRAQQQGRLEEQGVGVLAGGGG